MTRLDKLVTQYEQACNRRDWPTCDRLRPQIDAVLRHGEAGRTQ